jgi:hypothetical protein
MTGTKYIGMDVHKESISIAVMNHLSTLGGRRVSLFMVQLVRHRQTKGSATARLHLNHRVTPRLHTSRY